MKDKKMFVNEGWTSESDSDCCDECGMTLPEHDSSCTSARMDEDDSDGHECEVCGSAHCDCASDDSLHETDANIYYDPTVDPDEENDREFDEEHAEDACPGCGARPGDGVNPDCDDPMGCGYYKSLEDEVPEHSDEACPGCGAEPGDGINPDCDDPLGCGHYRQWKAAAGPVGHSLKHLLGTVRESVVFRGSRRPKDKITADYCGLPTNESAMFERFDRLVESKRDGSYVPRAKPVRTLNIAEAVTKIAEDVMREMKLSVAGPAFGGGSFSKEEDSEEETKDRQVKSTKPKKDKQKR